MTKRELFHAAFAFEKTDRFCHTEYGFWEETITNFKVQGLPDSVVPSEFWAASHGDIFDYFDILKCGYIRPENYMMPGLPAETLEETDEYIVTKNANGTTLKTSKIGYSLPQEIDHEIKNMETYKKYRDRLIEPRLEERIHEKIKANIESYRDVRDHAAICTHMDGFFGYPRELMGVQNMMYLFYDEPEFMHLLLRDRVDFYIKLYSPILKSIQLDYAFIWEDMCFKNGPLVSPDIFEKFMSPCYRKLISFFHDFGIRNIIVDSDGDVMKLMPLWQEVGVTGVLPFEVQAGMDVTKIAELFPKMVLIGGINKLELFKDKASIDAELSRVLPAMAKRGGYIAALDHWVPPEISLENFRYYVDKLHHFRF